MKCLNDCILFKFTFYVVSPLYALGIAVINKFYNIQAVDKSYKKPNPNTVFLILSIMWLNNMNQANL